MEINVKEVLIKEFIFFVPIVLCGIALVKYGPKPISVLLVKLMFLGYFIYTCMRFARWVKKG